MKLQTYIKAVLKVKDQIQKPLSLKCKAINSIKEFFWYVDSLDDGIGTKIFGHDGDKFSESDQWWLNTDDAIVTAGDDELLIWMMKVQGW